MIGVRFCCFVGGCQARGVVGIRHRRFGLVIACADHDPARHGYDRPYQDGPGPVREVSVPVGAPGQGGTRVPVTTPPSTRPPAPVGEVVF